MKWSLKYNRVWRDAREEDGILGRRNMQPMEHERPRYVCKVIDHLVW